MSDIPILIPSFNLNHHSPLPSLSFSSPIHTSSVLLYIFLYPHTVSSQHLRCGALGVSQQHPPLTLHPGINVSQGDHIISYPKPTKVVCHVFIAGTSQSPLVLKYAVYLMYLPLMENHTRCWLVRMNETLLRTSQCSYRCHHRYLTCVHHQALSDLQPMLQHHSKA